MNTIFRVLILLVCFLYAGTSWAQTAARLDMLSRAQANRLLLRWTPSSAEAWSNANSAGYTLTRTTVSSTRPTPSPTKVIPISGVGMANRSQWQPFITADSVWHKTLYYASTNDGSGISGASGPLSPEDRYFYATLAADNSFSAAVLAGLGYIDTDVYAGERYQYTLSTTASAGGGGITGGVVSLGLSDFSPLPKPLIDSSWYVKPQVKIRWDERSRRSTYGGYHVERATNGSNSYRRLTKMPFVQFGADTTQHLIYQDSLPNITRSYQYRLVGISYFDEYVTSDPVSITVTQKQDGTPDVRAVERVGSRYTIRWQYQTADATTRLDTVLRGFLVSVSNVDTTGYKPVSASVGYGVTSLSLTAAALANLVDTTRQFYVQVTAIGVTGDLVASLPYIMAILDRTPPAAPTAVTAVELNPTATGNEQYVRVSWQANPEGDLKGYRVFRRIGNEPEPIEVGRGIRTIPELRDTLTRNVNLPPVTYYVWAVDTNFHQSLNYGSAVFIQPDRKGPPAPMLTGYGPGVGGVTLFFDPSPESLMTPITHKILRSETIDPPVWQEVSVLPPGDTTTRFVDTSVEVGKQYVYSMVAIDGAGNTSCYKSAPDNCYQRLLVTVPKPAYIGAPLSFTARYDTLASQVNLGWVTNSVDPVQTYELYRGVMGGAITAWQVVDGSVNTAVDPTVEVGRTYQYKVRAVGTDGRSSAWVPVTVVCSVTALTQSNQPPQLVGSFSLVRGTVGTPLSYTVPYTAFTDTDGGIINVQLTGTPLAGLGLIDNRLEGTPTLPGTFTVLVTATDNRGATRQTSLSVSISTGLLPPTLAGSSTVCAGQAAILTASGCSGTVEWSTGATGATLTPSFTNTTANPVSMTYSARCRDSGGQSVYASPRTVWFIPTLPAPVFSAANTTLCAGNSLTLVPANTRGLVRWSGGFESAAWTVSPLQTTVYSATNVQNGCTSAPGQVTVTVKPALEVSVAGASVLCAGGSTSLSAVVSAGTSYSWTTGSTAPTIVVSQTGTYGLIAWNNQGCRAQYYLTVSTGQAVTATVTGTTALCTGTAGQLAASGGETYRWQDGRTTAAISITAAGIYSVTVTNGDGCWKPISTTVTPACGLALIEPLYNCSTGQFTFRTTGGNGGLIRYRAVPGVTEWNTSAGPYSVTVYSDTQPLNLEACQGCDAVGNGGTRVTYSWDPRPLCFNRPPVVATAITAQTASVGRSFSFVVPLSAFTDPDNQTLTYALSGLPDGLTATGGQISGVPSTTGVRSVTVVATDPGGLTARTTFSLTVNSPCGTASPHVVSGTYGATAAVVLAAQSLLETNPTTGFTVQNGANVRLQAGERIRLREGTRILPGSTFKATISPCN